MSVQPAVKNNRDLGAPPPLEPGDHLAREEFVRRYEAMPLLKKAELLRGVVYMPSPVSLIQHAAPHLRITTWLGVYEAATAGVVGGDNATLRLGPESEPQPDVLLMIPAHLGGRARVADDGYLEGGPELAVEVASSSVSYDLHVKKDLYAEHGVAEYLVWRVRDQDVDWFTLRGGTYHRLAPGEDGILRSEAFPGLWLDPAALVSGNQAQVLAVLHQGISSPEHAMFAQHLATTAQP